MPIWLWWSPLVLLVVGLAVWGFRWGWIAATITETDVITFYAAQYLTDAGATARLTDCTATPGTYNGVWIMVRCVSAQGARYEYPVDRFGRLLTMPRRSNQPEAPQT